MSKSKSTRSANHKLVTVIMRAFDRMAASPSRGPGTKEIRATFMSCVLGSHDERFDDWSDESVRAVLLAHALHCPIGELEEMARDAEDENTWLDGWEFCDRYEKICGKEITGHIDPRAVARALAGESKLIPELVDAAADLDWLEANAPKRYAAAMADIKRIVATEVTS